MLMMIDQDFGGPFSLAGWPLQGLSGRRKGDEIFFFHKLFVAKLCGIEGKKSPGSGTSSHLEDIWETVLWDTREDHHRKVHSETGARRTRNERKRF
jgi:hypothetical protein